MVTKLDLVQLFDPVSVNVYDAVEVGETVGLETVLELSPAGGLHEYALPVTAEAPMLIGVPEQIDVLAMTEAAGAEMVMVTES